MRTQSLTTDKPTIEAALLAAAQRSRTSTPAALDDLPDVLLIDELARVLRCSTWTIKHAMHNGTFSPLPIAKRPFRWLKADLVDALTQLRTAAEVTAQATRQVRERERARAKRQAQKSPTRRRRV
jgi:hypothetical protein